MEKRPVDNKESLITADFTSQLVNIYTPLENAEEEIWKRWNNKELKRDVEKFLGGNLPEAFSDKPKAVIGRHIASPNYEFLYFVNLSLRLKLDAICLEYLEDKFVSMNIDKYHLCKLYFYGGKGKRGGDKLKALKIVDFNETQGKRFCDVSTLWKESIVQFHHKLVMRFFPKKNKMAVDISTWLKSMGKNSEEFYIKYLALFLCHGVLFESFLLDKKEMNFHINIALPAINYLKEKFGLAPVIVKLEPVEEGAKLYWYSYPESLRREIEGYCDRCPANDQS